MRKMESVIYGIIMVTLENKKKNPQNKTEKEVNSEWRELWRGQRNSSLFSSGILIQAALT